MKIKLFFDSIDEFALFILSASALEFHNSFDNWSSFQKLGKFLPTETYWPFLDHVLEIRVSDVKYLIENTEAYANIHRSDPEADYVIENFMLNDVQMEADQIRAKVTTTGEFIKGSQNVRELIRNLPNSFLLIVGWRTDSFTYLFRKNTLDI